MPAIIPIPAFTDNYIRLVRAAAEAHTGRKLARALEALAVVRKRKNGSR